ncbi:MAG: FecR domain-containing protein [Odoribacteraceae bacterium]|jgi:ferric-dicitrate binding protein FerR (iron transport regulator)|nr:FecR domain-containing protein [Odoribacteraceae bacterium]
MNEQLEDDLLDCLQGKATDEQATRLREWIDESEEHRARYEQFCEVYYRAKHASAWNSIDERKAWRRLRAGRKRVVTRRYLSGVAAALLVAAGLWWIALPADDATCSLSGITRGGANEATLVLHDGSEISLASGTRVDMGYARAEGDSLSGLTYRETGDAPGEPEYNTLVVPRGGVYAMTLSDGTKVRVNAGSSVRYPVIFGRESREIHVEGEIFLEVRQDATRPFIVHSARAVTRVTGTSFNVMAYEDDAATEITLESGSVTVTAGGKTLSLVPGEQARVDHATGAATRHVVNTAYYTSWKEGLFDFDRMPLGELCTRLERWYDVKFRFISDETRSRSFTGAVKRDNTLQFMLDFIEKTSDTRFRFNGAIIEVHDQ